MGAGPEVAQGLPLAVTMGDPAGIGLEITLKAWTERRERELATFILYADPSAIAARARTLGLSVPLEITDDPGSAAHTFQSALPVRPTELAVAAQAGEPNPANARAVITAIEEATRAVVRQQAAGLVTNPIAKYVLKAAGFAHPGHTEFLACLASQHAPGKHFQPVMMLASRELRVVPMTVHCPLAEVPGSITRRLIFDTVRTTFEALKRDFKIAAPRIAVAGLNPHGGEEGNMGHEEKDIIAPAICELQSEGLPVTGPHSADSLFHPAARSTFDAAIAMYHDQALIPFKTIAFHEGVNVTLGLPFVRTSPDHGTAFDIAAKGSASARSFIESLRLAAAIAAARAAAPAA